jgi:hypothetical protein
LQLNISTFHFPFFFLFFFLSFFLPEKEWGRELPKVCFRLLWLKLNIDGFSVVAKGVFLGFCLVSQLIYLPRAAWCSCCQAPEAKEAGFQTSRAGVWEGQRVMLVEGGA